MSEDCDDVGGRRDDDATVSTSSGSDTSRS